MMPISGELWPYLLLVLVGFLPNEIWRWLGLIAARGLDEGSEILVWVRAVATAILAGVIAKLTIFAPGALASIPLSLRLAAVAAGFVGFVAIRRSVFAGVVAGEAVLVGGAFMLGHVERGKRTVQRFVYYDDLDPHCLDTGIVIFDGGAFGRLWTLCRETGFAVVADIHTHPRAARQSVVLRHPE